jgi:hypothetical protein
MKKLLTLTSVFVLIAAAATELATSAGLHAPATLGLGNAFLTFTVATFALIVLADYGRKPRTLSLRLRPAAALRRPSIAAAHHHVYAIRRGAEAARLARVPSRITYFPRRTHVRCERAA